MDQHRFAEVSRAVLQFDQTIEQLCGLIGKIGIPSPKESEWYELLKKKLLPQLTDRPFLVVALGGGTNTGKSVVFNHIAGENASAVDPRAAGTKHPVCLVSQDGLIEAELSPESLLERYFNGFTLFPWTRPDDPLGTHPEHRLYWRFGKNVPPRLLLLDTPDIDSDTEVNWDRANAVRQASDVLVAVLTAQKYNDAAVKRFFREAKDAAKPVILLFNMFDMNNDREALPIWLGQFHEATGLEPLAVYVVPFDRDKSASFSLPFYPVADNNIGGTAVSLRETLTELHFDEIKSQTLFGAIRRLEDRRTGVPKFFEQVRETTALFADAKRTLQKSEHTEIEWPGLPNTLLVEEVRSWWDESRPKWSKNVHWAYRNLGNGILWPFRKAWNALSKNSHARDPMEEFRKNEFDTVTIVVEKTIERFEHLSKTDNSVLRDELKQLLSGEHRRALLEQAKAAHASMKPIGEDFRVYLRKTLDDWTQENPVTLQTIRWLDQAAAVARPVVTLTLAVGGFAFAGDVLAQTAGTAIVGHLVGEAAIAGGVTGGGEAIVHQGGEGIKRGFANMFREIQAEYAKDRARQFFEWFQRELWSELIERLSEGESLAWNETFLHAVECADKLRNLAESDDV